MRELEVLDKKINETRKKIQDLQSKEWALKSLRAELDKDLQKSPTAE